MRLWMVCLMLTLYGCGGGGGNDRPTAAAVVVPPAAPAMPAPHSQCSLAEARTDVLDLFEQYYLFNDPEFVGQQSKYAGIRANLASYGSVDALLDDLRYQSSTFDRGFSYYATAEQVEQFFSAGEFFGFGFSVGIDFDGSWRLIDVFGDSPADLAGLIRTDTIVAVDGTPTTGLNLNSESTFGPSEAGVMRTLRIRSLDNSERDVNLTKQTVGLDSVPADRVKVFEVAGRKVGYLFFRTFIEDADDLLRAAIADLSAAGIDDLVLDLRYNGGGLVNTAETLGGLMVGPGQSGNLFFTYRHNSNLASSNDDMRFFPLEADGLPALENVYYLTDAGTASASELVISGVEPYMTRSVTLGARTFGKPVGQWGLEYCNDSMILFLVTFRTVNSEGVADYYSGIPADCAAADDWDHELSDPQEGRLRAALDYIETGGSACTPPPVMATMSQSDGVEFPKPGIIQGVGLAGKLLNAH